MKKYQTILSIVVIVVVIGTAVLIYMNSGGTENTSTNVYPDVYSDQTSQTALASTTSSTISPTPAGRTTTRTNSGPDYTPQPTSQPVSQPAARDTSAWNAYTFSGVSFRYPTTWQIELNGQTDVTLVPPTKTDANDVIVVGGANLQCYELSAGYTCREVRGIPFYTKSKNQLTLDILNAVVTSAY